MHKSQTSPPTKELSSHKQNAKKKIFKPTLSNNWHSKNALLNTQFYRFCIHVCKHHYSQDKSTFPSSQNVPLGPLQSITLTPLHPHGLQATTVLLSVTKFRLEFHMNRIIFTLMSTSFSHQVFDINPIAS